MDKKYGFDVSIIDHRRGLRALRGNKAARRHWMLKCCATATTSASLTFHHRRLQQIFTSAALSYLSLLDSSTTFKELIWTNIK